MKERCRMWIRLSDCEKWATFSDGCQWVSDPCYRSWRLWLFNEVRKTGEIGKAHWILQLEWSSAVGFMVHLLSSLDFEVNTCSGPFKWIHLVLNYTCRQRIICSTFVAAWSFANQSPRTWMGFHKFEHAESASMAWYQQLLFAGRPDVRSRIVWSSRRFCDFQAAVFHFIWEGKCPAFLVWTELPTCPGIIATFSLQFSENDISDWGKRTDHKE
jgi:hypothetical protein